MLFYFLHSGNYSKYSGTVYNKSASIICEKYVACF